MVRILIIQFRSEIEASRSEQRSLTRSLDGCSPTFKNALVDPINWEKPEKEIQGQDAVILAGSGELYFDGGYAAEHEGRVKTSSLANKAKPFAWHLLERGVPTLGICFGHQLLGYAAGVDVGHSKIECKTGTHSVELTDEGLNDALFRGLPRSFPAQYAHKDVLFDTPLGAVILARNGDRCRFAALRYGPRMYSVQFHPERRKEECIDSVKRYREYLPEGRRPEDVFKDTLDSESIMQNFVDIVRGV